ncbi:Protein kinase, putative [Hondaea fermentalgiana]|uniref:Protein kinase, putative n=1 Tax=Hondaea fermentalgiana TaxID=2315210 RepID=A0A2R5GNJ9_9STRA|nr:Protein kinase, putative [Hondaea fermentalgiana]|eukprot:GBG32460.1 Protein kinase, putative [Hondaea fermentalgiana]
MGVASSAPAPAGSAAGGSCGLESSVLMRGGQEAADVAALEAGLGLDTAGARRCAAAQAAAAADTHMPSPRAQTMSNARIAEGSAHAGFVISSNSKRKAGKRAPRDSTLSREERLAQALAPQGIETKYSTGSGAPAKSQHYNNSNASDEDDSCFAEDSSASSSTSSHSSASTSTSTSTNTSSAQAAHAPAAESASSTGIGSLVDLANSMTVEDLRDSSDRPTRRVKPRAPSSTQSPPHRHSSDVLSGSSAGSAGDVVREPVSLRSFEILKVLGRGSHGKVYLVKHRSTGVLYAMKQLKKDNVMRQRQEANTRRELRVNVAMQEDDKPCPFIVPLRFAFHSRSRLYMVFDFMKGGELYTHLSIRGRLPEVLARFYAAEIAIALAALHAKGFIYRDLKPENLLLDEEGHILLADFGLCQDGISSATAGSTTFAGTCEYLAPEILNYKEHGFAVDYWALGMVVYELLTGLPPFYSYNQQEVVDGILNKTLEFPRYVSPSARNLVERLLDRNPATRLGSRRGFDEVLEHPFFQGFDWMALAARESPPPFRPPSDDVVCNFDPEFTQQRLDAEPDYVPPRTHDVFDGFYFDSEDPINGSPSLERVATDPALSGESGVAFC